MRTLLILGRVSSLPTIWSNCLAGWWLSGGGNWLSLVWVTFGCSLLYVAGMFLNDAFDAQYDRQRRVTRPIPSGAITEREVWSWGLGLLVLGIICLAVMGLVPAILTLFLVGTILVYEAIHKAVALAPVLMAFCRCLVYLIGASVAARGIAGLAIWSSLALGAYVVGVSYLARKADTQLSMEYWPLLFLAAPFFLAWLVNEKVIFHPVGVIFVGLIVWVLLALRLALWSTVRNIGYGVSMLLAGIPLVDCLAVGEPTHPISWLFVAWFLLVLVLQQRIPAT